MLSHNDTLLAETLTEVLERMAFISPLPREADAPEPAEAWKVSMAISGATSRSVELIATPAFAALLAANVMGEATRAEAQARAGDALKELLNVICGALATKWAQASGGPVEIGLPKLAPAELPADWRAMVQTPGAIIVDVEGSPLAIGVRQAVA